MAPTGSRTHPRIELHRIYDAPGHDGRYRVLVDRLWPRGVKKQDAGLDEWAKDVAPSDELRRWYGHEPERFAEFERRYRDELRHAPASDVVQHLRDVARDRPVVLLTATRDVEHSGGKVLFDHLSRRVSRARPGRGPRA
jgi:uncharacterized protein YeaO (DUF488 family)